MRFPQLTWQRGPAGRRRQRPFRWLEERVVRREELLRPEEDVVCSNDVDEPITPQLLHDGLGHVGEDEGHAMLREFLRQRTKDEGAREVDVGDGGRLQAEPAHRGGCMRHEIANLFGQPVGVGVVQAGAEAVDQQAGLGLPAGAQRVVFPVPPSSGTSRRS